MKRKNEEIYSITKSPRRRPYASKVTFILAEGLEYGFDGESCMLLDTNFIVRMKPVKDQNDRLKSQKFIAVIEGFATAREAEDMGLRLSFAILWAAVSKKWYLKLDYDTPQPCTVFDRTQNRGGLQFSGYMDAVVRSNAHKVVELMQQILLKPDTVDPRLFISMELFASAKFESSERARFIALVSSLEPLAIQNPYNNEDLDTIVSGFIAQLNSIQSIQATIRNSIINRARLLKTESISQAIQNLVKSYFPDHPHIIEIVKEAYDIRSRILHDGSYDTDLEEIGQVLEDILRHIYSRKLQLDLSFPTRIRNV